MTSRPAVSCSATAARMALPIRRSYSSSARGQSSAMSSRTNCGRGSEPITEVGNNTSAMNDSNQYLAKQVLRHPVLSRVLEILLRIDFDIAARRVDMTKPLALFDHVLKQQYLVCVFEIAGITPRLTGEFFPPAFVILT